MEINFTVLFVASRPVLVIQLPNTSNLDRRFITILRAFKLVRENCFLVTISNIFKPRTVNLHVSMDRLSQSLEHTHVESYSIQLK